MKLDRLTIRHIGPIRAVIEAAADELGTSPLVFIQSRKFPIAHARQLVMKVARDRTGASYPVLGRAFQRHHSTVMHGCDEAEKLLASDAWAQRFVDRVAVRADLKCTADRRVTA